jgi:hypothetical protein
MRKSLENVHCRSNMNESANNSPKIARRFFNVYKRLVINSIGLILLKFIYLITGMTGLAGTLYIIVRVVSTDSVSNLNMVLIFGLACLTIAITYAGLYGFTRLRRDSYRPKVNTSHSSHASKKGAA